MKRAFIIVLLAITAQTILGDGVSAALTNPERGYNWSCIDTYTNVTDVVIPCWNLAGQDTFCNWNYKYALANKFQRLDLLVDICPNCTQSSSASQFIYNLYYYLNQNNITAGTLYLAVRYPSLWNQSSYQQNLNWIVTMVQAAEQYFNVIGIYSNYSSWSSITGNNWNDTLYDAWPWYEHYSSSPNFQDWSTNGFGHWDRPAMKSYGQTTSHCGGYSLLYHP